MFIATPLPEPLMPTVSCSEPFSLFAADAELAALEDRLRASPEPPELSLLVALAWQLRQRDTRRAVALADTAAASLSAHDQTSPRANDLRARLALVRAEAHWLLGDSDAARVWLDAAASLFASTANQAGVADVHWLLSSLANDDGQPELADGHLGSALACLASSGDTARLQITLLRQICETALRDVEQARCRLDEHMARWPKPEHPATAAWWEAAQSIVLSQMDRVGDCVPRTIAAQEMAQASGQLRMAVVFASNVGVAFENLQDLGAAMVWHELALALGRRTGWTGTLGTVQCRAASALCDMGKPEAALAMLQEAVPALSEGSRMQGIGWLCMGEALHALGQHADALVWLAKSAERARCVGAFMDLASILSRQTLVSIALGDLDHARHCNDEAMEVATAHGLLAVQCEVHMDAAQLDLARRAQGVGSAGLDDQILSHLMQALQIAQSIEAFNTPPLLLQLLAAEHAHRGEMGAAYRVSLEMANARERAQGQEAANRATALQIQHETERHKREAEHLRELSLVQAQRSEVLARANVTLEQLGEAGRSITASLDASKIFSSLNSFSRQLLDSHSVVISRFKPELKLLQMEFGMEDAVPMPALDVVLDDPINAMARCARERREILIDANTVLDARLSPPETAANQSGICGPLIVGERLLGVMTVKFMTPRARSEPELSIFRTLCSYGAIALANAEAQAKVIAQNHELELLASVDSLTGLFNRRHLNQGLAREVATAERHGQDFSLILLDIDRFKQINDVFGHLAGDAVLTGIGVILNGRVRATDLAGRWGGEEFLVICPNTGTAEAVLLAEALRVAISQQEFPEVGSCTASFGVATYLPGDTPRMVEQRADLAMYQAKQAGRNQVASYVASPAKSNTVAPPDLV